MFIIALRIHVSESVKNALANFNGFSIESKGLTEVKVFNRFNNVLVMIII